MTLLATTSRSDEISEIWWWLGWVCFVLPIILGIVSLTLGFVSQSKKRVALWIAVAGALMSLYSVFFALYVYQVDFVAVGRDGTAASSPLSTVMIWPSLPLMVCLLAIFMAYIKRNRKSMA